MTISISGTVAKDTIVSYTIGGTGAGETATKGTDFDVNLPLQVTFRPGVTFQKFEIAITDDNVSSLRHLNSIYLVFSLLLH